MSRATGTEIGDVLFIALNTSFNKSPLSQQAAIVTKQISHAGGRRVDVVERADADARAAGRCAVAQLRARHPRTAARLEVEEGDYRRHCATSQTNHGILVNTNLKLDSLLNPRRSRARRRPPPAL